MTATPEQVDLLMDAIDLLNADQREQARAILRSLIQEDSDFEDAWLWMSLAVDTLDQATVCLENALRVNPKNARAAEALLRLRAPDMAITRRRDSLREWRDLVLGLFWMLFFGTLCASLATYAALMEQYRASLGGGGG
jgi:tetratricopeptide (TPR) repeat protein